MADDPNLLEAAEAIGMKVFMIDEDFDFSQLPSLDDLLPPVPRPFDGAQTITLDDGERPLIILAIETYLQDYEDDFVNKPEDSTWADWNVFVSVYRQMLRVYYAFTSRDFFGSHGFITNFSGREEGKPQST